MLNRRTSSVRIYNSFQLAFRDVHKVGFVSRHVTFISAHLPLCEAQIRPSLEYCSHLRGRASSNFSTLD